MEDNQAYRTKLPFIIAVDFDGTLVSDKFPEIGEPNHFLFYKIKQWQAEGCKIILWTCRDNDTAERQLDLATMYCYQEHRVQFDAINRNVIETINMFNNDTRKVYANLYIDDKNVIPDFNDNWEPTEFVAWKKQKHSNREG